MKIWKLILATLVIFATGVITGGVLTRHASTHIPAPNSGSRHSPLSRPDFLQRMSADLKLTPDQTNRLDTIIRKSHQRTEPLWDLIRPLLDEETTRVRSEIKAELTPEQQAKFEELTKSRYTRRPDGEPGGPGGPHPPGSHYSHSRSRSSGPTNVPAVQSPIPATNVPAVQPSAPATNAVPQSQ